MLKIKEINIVNKKAGFEYILLQKYTAGMQLTGTEVKSIRLGNANLNDAFCFFKGDELFIRGLNIGTFKQGSHFNHEPTRIRKLLLRKKELVKIKVKGTEKGIAIIPIRIFETDRGFLKIEIALGQGKKAFDKRESIKERDVERNLRRLEN
ncbi:MAG: SsrA-binding protein SmpB [Sphingobacteriales bacterium]|jgi:SsrA-binding protein|nr:SsrA-binding protein SmpB [Sphingobacteriales bacterium]